MPCIINTTGSITQPTGSYAFNQNTTGVYNSANGYAALYANTPEDIIQPTGLCS